MAIIFWNQCSEFKNSRHFVWPLYFIYPCHIIRTTMVTVYENGIFKSKINGITKRKIISMNLILIIDWWNNRCQPIKSTYHSVTWIILSKTLSEGQSPSRENQKSICSWQWDQKLGTKDAMFTSSSQAILND